MEPKMIQLLLMLGLVVVCSANQQCNIICGDPDDDSVSSPSPKPTPTFGNLIRGKAGPKGNKGEPSGACEALSEEVREYIAAVKAQLTEHELEVGNLQNKMAQMSDQLISMAEIVNRLRLRESCRDGTHYAGIQDSNIIRDDQLTASSTCYFSGSGGDYEPRHARLLIKSGGGHWIPAENRVNEWIQVDLERNVTVVGVVTQGSYMDYDEYVTSYNILYRTDNSANLQAITDDSGNAMIFSGNNDDDTPRSNKFPQPVTARYFRLNVLSWNRKIAVRFDLLLC